MDIKEVAGYVITIECKDYRGISNVSTSVIEGDPNKINPLAFLRSLIDKEARLIFAMPLTKEQIKQQYWMTKD